MRKHWLFLLLAVYPGLLMMENIVGVVLIFTIPAWALAGYLVHIILDKPLFQRFMKASEGTDLGKWIQNIPKKKEVSTVALVLAVPAKSVDFLVADEF